MILLSVWISQASELEPQARELTFPTTVQVLDPFAISTAAAGQHLMETP